MSKTKPFIISKRSIMAAWKSVKANQGSEGVDDESIIKFESNLRKNLYKLWNRMSSGTYFPSPVKAMEIPKTGGGTRILGIPTVMDRVAQAAVKSELEAIVETKFHEDSYGYRPGKSALEAVGVARKRCWQQEWCIDMDIKEFFDNLDHKLMMKAIQFHTNKKWVHLYVERWLKAPIQQKDGVLVERECGTPQGGVISPLLANIFMHHAFDEWIKRHFSYVRFERFADDILVHCSSKEQAETIKEAIKDRLQECGLELHLEKTKIVYCKNKDGRNSKENKKFDFLGYTFRPRIVRTKHGKNFVGFTPAISDRASKRISKEIRSWRIHLRSDKSLTDLANMFNAKVQGWINYYGAYHKSAIYPVLRNIERYLTRWVTRKYKRYRGHKRRARKWLGRIRSREPHLFAHWKLGLGSPV